MSKRLLLDTNVALWLLLGERESVSAAARVALEDQANAISVSAVSFWEIAIKRSLGKLRIAAGWAEALTRLDLEPMPVISLHARGVEDLPWHHKDPFDRLLVSQALLEGHSLVSADTRLQAYGIEVVW